jgi:hypothetical protein
MTADRAASLHVEDVTERARHFMSEIEPFDWTPEIDLVKGLSPRLGAVLQYAQAVSERTTVRRQMFVGAVLEDSNLATDEVIKHLHNDERLSALFETALEVAARSSYESMPLTVACRRSSNAQTAKRASIAGSDASLVPGWLCSPCDHLAVWCAMWITGPGSAH